MKQPDFQFNAWKKKTHRSRCAANEVHSPGCNWNGQSYFGGWCEGEPMCFTEIEGQFSQALEVNAGWKSADHMVVCIGYTLHHLFMLRNLQFN